MSRKLLEIALAVLALTGFVIGCYGLFCIRGSCRGVSLCDTTMYVDTLVYYRPVPRDSAVVRYVTRWLALAEKPDTDVSGTVAEKPDTDVSGTVAEKPDTDVSGTVADGPDTDVSGTVASNMPPDSVRVIVPITQKRYEGDGYRVYVSGYEVNLDSVYVFQRIAVVHERSCKPPDRWHIGITGGYGYGFKSKQAEPYIGIGITYSIISFAF